MKIAFGIEYDGSAYHGWQSQNGVPTIQDSLEKALAIIADQSVKVVCAGRTDTGVHSLGQIIHIETEVEREESSWLFGTNSNLPSDISVLWVKKVHDDFHARFSATRRVYEYHILNRRARSALLNNKIVWERRPLSLERMKKGAYFLIGSHDFSAYRSLACQANSPLRTVHKLEVVQQGAIITLEIEANAFLHHMVRNIAGVLMEIGMGNKNPEWAREVLESKDRRKGGVTAPPEGLYLMKVSYPEKIIFPEPDQVSPIWDLVDF